MNLARFLNYIVYSNVCPDGIHPARWRAMLTWFETRQRLGEPLTWGGGVVTP